MNRLTLGALTALAATQLAGCIITSDNDVDRYITVNWQLKYVGSDVLEPCPAGYDTIAFYTQEVDASGNPLEAPVLEVFPCSAGTAISAPLPPATYLSWIEIINGNNTATYAQSTSAYLDVRSGNGLFDADIFYDGGYFQFAWRLENAFTRETLLCSDDPPTAKVGILTSLATPAGAYDDRYPCEKYTAITPELVAGTYTADVAALDAQGSPVGDSLRFTNQIIRGPNVVTQMPHDMFGNYMGVVTLPIDPP